MRAQSELLQRKTHTYHASGPFHNQIAETLETSCAVKHAGEQMREQV